MRNTNAPSTAGELRSKTQPVFSVVLAYDTFDDGIRAKDLFDTLVLDHSELFQFTCHLWKLDVLREPQLLKAATRDALRADMIVLAIRQWQQLPVEAKRWIEHWLPARQADSGALVLLLGGKPRQVGDTTNEWASLKQLAESVHVQVFCKDTTWPAVDSHLTMRITNPTSRGTAELINALVKWSPTHSLTKV